MEETQAIDFDDLPSEEEPVQADIHQVAGELQTVSEPAHRLPLYLGLNVVGRGSSQADQEVMLNKWKADFSGMPLHDLESAGAVCWVKDLGSRNKTMLGRAGGLTVLQSRGDRYSVLPGDKLKFGYTETTIQYSRTYHQDNTVGGVQPGTNRGDSSHATDAQRHVSRSPTPDMAAAQAPPAPSAATDNDMTLPWDEPLDDQQDFLPKGSAGYLDDAAVSTETPAHEPSHKAEQLLTEAPILPDTQANDLPTDLPGNTDACSREVSVGPQDIALAEPTQLADALTHLVGEPTQLMGEPTQLALPADPVAAASTAPRGSQAGTALASAAAQAMTGARPFQASVLPSSGGFPTAMPSLAQPQPAPGQSFTGSALAQNSGPAHVKGNSLPISGPEADAVLHLPSQPSGSQHAAHPHGPPRSRAAASADPAAPKPGSHSSQQQDAVEPSHQEQTLQSVAALQKVQRDSAAAGTGSSDHNTLLDSVLGHDDDDSIWMPPASLPDSEGPNEGGVKPANLPSQGGQDMPLQLQAPMAGAAEGSAPAGAPIPQQTSDSNQTQDSQPEAVQDSQQDADADTAVNTSAPPAAARGPNHSGSTGRALPHAEEDMYTGAFAFPDSASLEVSQPAVGLPHKSGRRGQLTTAGRPAAQGKAAKAAAGSQGAPQGKAAAAEAGKEAAPAVEDGRAAAAKHTASAGAGASSGGSPKGRVMPSGWKKKKTDPLAEAPAGTAAEAATDTAEAATDTAVPSARPTAGALQGQVPPDESQQQEPPPSTTHVAHGAGKPTPWRVRGIPLGVGSAAGPSQLPNSEDINAAMAAAGDLAAFFPSTQAEPEVDASIDAPSTVGPPRSPAATSAVAAPKSNAVAAAAEKSIPAAARTDPDGAQAVPDHAALPQQASASTDAEHGHGHKATSESGHMSAKAEQQADVAAEADSRSADEASHAQADEAEDDQTYRGAAPRQASRRKQPGRAAEEQEGPGSAVGHGRGRGSRGKGRGQGRGRSRKRNSPDTASVEDAQPQAKATKGKRGRSKGREATPALQPTRVSKRQKAKAEAQATDTAQQEEEADHTSEDDPFVGAATQAAAGILEDLRRSATPDEDADADEPAGAAPPALHPTMKGKRSTSRHTARPVPAAEPEATAAAAKASAQGSAVAESLSSGKSARPKRRASAQSKATAASEGSDLLHRQDSAGRSGAPASTAAQSDGHASTAAGASEEQGEGSQQVKRGQKRRAGADSTAQERRKSRLSKASSPAPEPSPVADAAPETLTEQPSPARRSSAEQPLAEKQQRSGGRGTSAPKRKSGTGSTDVKRQRAAADETAPEQAEKAAGSGGMQEAAEEPSAGTSKASSVRGKAKRKSALTSVVDEHPPATSGGARRGSRAGQPASKQAEAAAAAHVAPAATSAADESASTATASKAKQRSRLEQTLARRHSQATAAAKTAKEQAQPSAASGATRRGSQDKAGAARVASQSEAAAAEDDGEEEACPSVQQPGGDGAAAEKGAQAKGKTSRGKRSRESMEDAAADAGPADHVKAARKATDSKPVRVLYSTALDKAKKSSMTKIIRRLGCSVEDAEGPEFTHFVALQPSAANQTDRGFKKSINALIALAAGRPIVSETWVEACGRSSSFVDPLDHLLIDKAAQKKFGFDMRTSYERAQHQLLLAGLHIFFSPGALAGESDGGTNIKNLVEHAGGMVNAQLPKTVSSSNLEVLSQWLLIGSENDKAKDQKLCRKHYAAGLTFHGRSMLIDSIMQQCLDRKHGVLYTT